MVTPLRYLFILLQLVFAVYFTYNAWTSWDANPIVTSINKISLSETPFPAVTICLSDTGKWTALARAAENLDINGTEFAKALVRMMTHFNSDEYDYGGIWMVKIVTSLLDLSYWLAGPREEEEGRVHDFLKELNATKEVTRLAYYLAYILENRIALDQDELLVTAVNMKLSGQGHIILKAIDSLCLRSGLICDSEVNKTEADIWMSPYIGRGFAMEYTPYEVCWQPSLVQNSTDLSDWCHENWISVRPRDLSDIKETVYSLLIIENTLSTESLIELMIFTEVRGTSVRNDEFTEYLLAVLERPFPVSLPLIWDLVNGELGSDSPGLIHPNWTDSDWKSKSLECSSINEQEPCDEIKDMSIGALKALDPSMLSVILTSFSQQQSPVRLCSFSNKIDLLSECSYFKLADTLSMHMHKCYTFNGKGEFNDQAIHKLGPQRGLTLLLEASDLANVEPVNFGIVIHEPGVTPDIANIHENHIEASSGRATTISLKPTVYTTSDGFNSMSFDKRNCWIDNDEDNHYHEANCIYEFKIATAIENCNCTPWFRANLSENSVKPVICEHFGMVCYKSVLQSDELEKELMSTKCKAACRNIEYSPSVSSEMTMQKAIANSNVWPWGRHKATVEQYLWDAVYPDGKNKSKVNPLTAFSKHKSILDERLKKMALISINFGEPHAMMIMQDAKVTFADMIGNVGGTFGIFLGISMITLFDLCLDAFSFVKKNKSSFQSIS